MTAVDSNSLNHEETSLCRQKFLDDMGKTCPLEHLYEFLSDVYFFAKNLKSQFVMCNQSFAEKCGAQRKQEIWGRTDLDFFPHDRATRYIKDDQFVMQTGKDIIDRVELSPEIDGAINWVITTKIPIRSSTDEIIGVAGIARDSKKALSTFSTYFEMSNILKYIQDNYDDRIEIADLAAMAHLSVSQFERKFKKTFQTSPVKHITNVRLNAAKMALKNTNKTISTIAIECGFFDHSHFSRHFKNAVHMSPRKYRNKL